jgi:hypothetical protein
MKKTIILIWVLALGVALFIVKGTKIGPIILTVSEKYGLGVHTGDFLALIPVLFAGTGTLTLLQKREA